ncbi:gliding motility-associated C-terminal domain-containing protein [Mucilaginibacter rigui]|uniref:Gliding motility-associated C-terminal domain-containing protein n=1 Tax=Mucilaginibacter rigui TaxID=534635 RepID=A0ABR7X7C5_9SPHI|nr:gliding motility-associated C-terminal domain-containing protein [Mucilaginibacter rigui]MBD1385985.1 gliding motility-associated C-terminal domain-containing protein [Mucilaginibacter rigui]
MQFKLRFLLFILLLFAGTVARAQVCTGTLGDPVFTQDFGSPTRTATPIVTGYTYTSSTCPSDGSYTIANNTSACFGNAWHTVLRDHTGDPGGYMMIVNADETPGKEFFKQTTDAGGLCEKTTYEFSAYVMNLISPNGSHIKPNLSFIIESLDGTVIKNYPTGDIPESAGSDGWVKYGTFFKTSPGVTQVVIRIVNNAPGGNGNDLLLDDIAFRACGPDVHVSFSGDVSVIEKSVCVGSPATYHLTTPQITAYDHPRYQWQVNDGTGWSDIPGATNSFYDVVLPANTPVGAYQYKIGLAEGDNITSLKCRAYSNPVTINITSYPDPPAPTASPICEGEQLTLTASGGATYKWNGPGISETSQNPLIIPHVTIANQGQYHVEVISAAGCSTFRNVDVTVNPKPIVTVGQVLPVCRGNGIQVAASVDDVSLYTYSWLPAAGLSDANVYNPIASPDNSTLYTVTVTNKITNCFNTAQVQVNVLDVPVAHAGNDKKIFEGQSIKLDGSAEGNVTYSWSPPDYLDDPHSPTPIATPPHNMPYLLTVTSANGCGINTDEVFIRVFQKIVIPSTFTPNNDGVNDIWNIEALETYPQSTISVYTRNGKQVFQSRGYGKPWDGKLNGTLLPAGTYYYVIDLENGMPNMSGWVLLVR